MYNIFFGYRKIDKVKYFFHFVAILALQLFFCQEIIASSANQGYTPPFKNKSTSNQRRQASGSRGCRVGENFISLDLLDVKSTDLTAEKNKPIVVFSISEIPKEPVIVTLTEPNTIEPIFETTINVDRSGIWYVAADIKDSFSEDRHYVTTVLLACNNFNPSQSIYVRSLYYPY